MNKNFLAIRSVMYAGIMGFGISVLRGTLPWMRWSGGLYSLGCHVISHHCLIGWFIVTACVAVAVWAEYENKRRCDTNATARRLRCKILLEYKRIYRDWYGKDITPKELKDKIIFVSGDQRSRVETDTWQIYLPIDDHTERGSPLRWPSWRARLVREMLYEWLSRIADKPRITRAAYELQDKFCEKFPEMGYGPRYFQAILDKADYLDSSPEQLARGLSECQPVIVNDGHTPISEIIVQIGHWLAICAALAYVSGFLVTSIFFDQFGIRDAATDLVRTKYIMVGIQFLLFPLTFLLPIGVYVGRVHMELKRQDKRNWIERMNRKGHNWVILRLGPIPASVSARLSSLLMSANIILTLYITMLFTDRGYFLKNSLNLLSLLLVTIFGTVGVNILSKKYLSSHFVISWAAHVFIRGTLIAFIVWIDYRLFGFQLKHLWRLLWGSSIYKPGGVSEYILFMTAIALVVYRSNWRIHRAKEMSMGERTAARITSSCMAILFYFCAIDAFALRVYPFVSDSKGGGNYEESPFVKIYLKPDLWPSKSAHLSEARTLLTGVHPLIAVEQTSTSIFVADSNDVGGPSEWKTMVKFPTVYEVARDAIEEIKYIPRPQDGKEDKTNDSNGNKKERDIESHSRR